MDSSDAENSDSNYSEVSDQNESSSVSKITKKATPAKSPIFTQYEKSLLLELVRVNKKIVESKKTDFGVNQLKKGAWDKIATAFCSEENTSKRSGNQLKKAWHNMKRLAKKDNCSRKKKLKKTGGGPAVPELKPDTLKINCIIPIQMESLENPFDSDNVVMDELKPADMTDKVATIPVIKEMVSAQAEQTKAKEIQRRKYKDARSSMIDMEYEEHRMRLTTLKLQQRIEERKMEILEEQHSAKMKIFNSQLSSAIYDSNI